MITVGAIADPSGFPIVVACTGAPSSRFASHSIARMSGRSVVSIFTRPSSPLTSEIPAACIAALSTIISRSGAFVIAATSDCRSSNGRSVTMRTIFAHATVDPGVARGGGGCVPRSASGSLLSPIRGGFFGYSLGRPGPGFGLSDRALRGFESFAPFGLPTDGIHEEVGWEDPLPRVKPM